MGQEIQVVAVIGTGILGTQIAINAAHFGYKVFAYDSDAASFSRAHENIKSRLKTGADEGSSFTVNQWDVSAKGVHLCKDLSEAVGHADLVIEAVPENIVLKRKVFESIDALAPAKSILASNSSSIPISKIESSTTRPEQCLNIHFYSPATGRNMADIMGGTKTTPEVMETGKGWIRSVGCVPLTVKKESLGFCFNRVWRAIKRETLHMWAEGIVDFKDIDRAWMIYSGMPRGPFGLMDNVGLDVVYDIEMVYFNESKDPKDHPPDALKMKIEKKELGFKTGQGFYSYPNPEYMKTDFLKGQWNTRRIRMRKAVQEYLWALEAGDVHKTVSLFEPDGWVLSPFLGRMTPHTFFPKVVEASDRSKITVHDILISSEGQPRAVGYFLYDWWLKDGSKVSFECADVFTFNPKTGKILSMVILYDTYPIRDAVGDKFA